MAQSKSLPQITVCDRCGESAENGYEERGIGTIDPETGYRDYETVCASCSAEEREVV